MIPVPEPDKTIIVEQSKKAHLNDESPILFLK